MTPESTGPSFAAQLGGTALALVVVLALAWLALRALKRLQDRSQATSGGGTLQVLASVGVGPRERIVAVRWHGRELLIGVSAGGVTRLAERTEAGSSGEP